MIVSRRKRAELTGKTFSAAVVDARRAGAVASPVAHRKKNPVQKRIRRVDRSPFAGGHVVRRIKTGCADIAPCPGQTAVIPGAERVAVVLDEPQVVPVAELLHRRKVERIAQRMRQHHCPGPSAQGSFQTRRIHIRRRSLHIHKNRNRSILEDR